MRVRMASERITHKPSSRSFKDRALVLFSFVLILFATVFLISKTPILNPPLGSKISETPQNLSQKLPSFSSQLNPSLYHTNGTEVIYQIPSSPKAVFFVAHGCNLHAYDFWDKSPNCAHCTGLPEDRLFVLQALELNMAVITISSLGKCWSFQREMENVQWIIQTWAEKHKLENLPKFAMGASSGGYFVSALSTRMEFRSICIMIAEGVFGKIGIPKNYPPTLFVHMVKDRIRAAAVLSNVAELRDTGIEVKEIRCEEFPLDANFLAKRIPGLDKGFGDKLIQVFHEKGFLDEKGYLKKDGRAIKWKEALLERKLIPEKFELFSHVNEELNLAFGYHEFTSLKNDEIFEWFESHMRRN
ncbi:hypothetical protein LUZ63_015191 [Rhynchospora breviuscula]|uniref:Uncharacterized protein n=1 Tax=Rhynchospora breviuscula TaxID=2022672 RepID=A0A9Q0CBU4_9POAL|nr:hypothetical protein LUZ63_015191 [Rhynchospora breviuscula]